MAYQVNVMVLHKNTMVTVLKWWSFFKLWLDFKQEMDIESLEAANQSLQADLKLAFKRIGDLQAAMEDEMETDDDDDLINRYED